jgi:hypothetical protein
MTAAWIDRDVSLQLDERIATLRSRARRNRCDDEASVLAVIVSFRGRDRIGITVR